MVNKRIFVFFLLLLFIGTFTTCEKKSITPAPESLPAEVSFKNDIQPMFTLYCSISGCHSGTKPAAKLNLTTSYAFSNLFSKKMIDTITPAQSRLYTSLSSPMPPWAKLTSYDTDLILKWIQQGAKNN